MAKLICGLISPKLEEGLRDFLNNAVCQISERGTYVYMLSAKCK